MPFSRVPVAAHQVQGEPVGAPRHEVQQPAQLARRRPGTAPPPTARRRARRTGRAPSRTRAPPRRRATGRRGPATVSRVASSRSATRWQVTRSPARSHRDTACRTPRMRAARRGRSPRRAGSPRRRARGRPARPGGTSRRRARWRPAPPAPSRTRGPRPATRAIGAGPGLGVAERVARGERDGAHHAVGDRGLAGGREDHRPVVAQREVGQRVDGAPPLEQVAQPTVLLGVEAVRTVGGGRATSNATSSTAAPSTTSAIDAWSPSRWSTNSTGPVIPNRPRNAWVDRVERGGARGLPVGVDASATASPAASPAPGRSPAPPRAGSATAGPAWR